VWADGRPDELVRGVDLIGTPLVTFSRITAASDAPQVFNGVCGAESGWVPVSAVAPDLLVSEVEVQRREKQNDRPPLLPPPSAGPGPAEGARP
jgi:predicted Zn-dependent protease